jgi:membrane-bound lytic murein transglycosylase A
MLRASDRRRPALCVAALLLLGACATMRPSATVPSATVPPAASAVAVRSIGRPSGIAGFAEAEAEAGMRAFHDACPRLLARPGRSGLVQPADWAAPCGDRGMPAAAFFDRYFTAVQLGDGRGFATGYFEPEIAASRTPVPGAAPIYRVPGDLVQADLGAFAPDLSGRTIRGRIEGSSLVPYYDRSAIEAGALAGRGLELAWALDPVALFFLQIQGSGVLRFADGSVQRIGYAGQNGRPYVAIGRLLKQRGVLERAGMDEIIGWLHANPEAGTALMRENPSYVFFSLRPDAGGPLGALGVPLVAQANAAVDPAVIPFGVPLLVRIHDPALPQPMLLVAADAGGAIRGPNRIDVFFGRGPRAHALAAALGAPLDLWLLLPNAAAQRLSARP